MMGISDYFVMLSMCCICVFHKCPYYYRPELMSSVVVVVMLYLLLDLVTERLLLLRIAETAKNDWITRLNGHAKKPMPNPTRKERTRAPHNFNHNRKNN